MGAAGIFVGTVISTVTVCIWVEPYVLFKYVFKASPKKYFGRLIMYTAVTAVTCGVTYFLCSLITLSAPLAAFIAKAAVCATVPYLIFLVLFGRTGEFGYFFGLVKKIIRGILNRN